MWTLEFQDFVENIMRLDRAENLLCFGKDFLKIFFEIVFNPNFLFLLKKEVLCQKNFTRLGVDFRKDLANPIFS